MRLLLDSHTFLWAAEQPHNIPLAAMESMTNPLNTLLLSTATLWEIAIKHSIGKLALSLPYRSWMEKAINDLDLQLLPINLQHLEKLVL